MAAAKLKEKTSNLLQNIYLSVTRNYNFFSIYLRVTATTRSQGSSSPPAVIYKMITTSGFLAALECTKFVFGQGSAPHPGGRAYSAPQGRPAGLR